MSTKPEDHDETIVDDTEPAVPLLDVEPEPVLGSAVAAVAEGDAQSKNTQGPSCIHPTALAWDASQNSVKFLDSALNKYHSINVETLEHSATSLGENMSFVAMEAASGDLLVGDASYVRVVDARDGSPTTRNTLVHLPSDVVAKGGKITAGKVSPYGELFVGVTGSSAGSSGDLLRVVVPKDGAKANAYTLERAIYTSHVLKAPVDFAWDHGGRSMYIADAGDRTLVRYVTVPFRQTLENRETIYDFSKSHADARPSSLAVDSKGNIWIALDGAGELMSISASKRTDQTFVVSRIKTPFNRINSIAFGGQSMQDLYVAGVDTAPGASPKDRIPRGRIVKFQIPGGMKCQ